MGANPQTLGHRHSKTQGNRSRCSRFLCPKSGDLPGLEPTLPQFVAAYSLCCRVETVTTGTIASATLSRKSFSTL